MNLLDKDEIQSYLPEKIHLTTSNGNFTLTLNDGVVKKSSVIIAGPTIFISYCHSTPTLTDDPLSDGEPDNLSIDLQVKKKGEHNSLYFDITYGDAMMFSFEVGPNNFLKVGHYNGHNSKFDPEYQFFFQEETIDKLLYFINHIADDIKITRDKLNFLDGDKDSFKMEKVNHRRIVDFRNFNPQGLL